MTNRITPNPEYQSKMSPELIAALAKAKDHVMSPEEIFEQRVSFVYSGVDTRNPNHKTKDDIREMLIQQTGVPAKYSEHIRELESDRDILLKTLKIVAETFSDKQARLKESVLKVIADIES